jgi:fatty acid desaturase
MMLGCAGHASAGFGVDGVIPVRVVAFLTLLLVTGVIMHFIFHGSSSKNDCLRAARLSQAVRDL